MKPGRRRCPLIRVSEFEPKMELHTCTIGYIWTFNSLGVPKAPTVSLIILVITKGLSHLSNLTRILERLVTLAGGIEMDFTEHVNKTKRME